MPLAMIFLKINVFLDNFSFFFSCPIFFVLPVLVWASPCPILTCQQSLYDCPIALSCRLDSPYMTVLLSYLVVSTVPVWLSSCPILTSQQSLYDCPLVLFWHLNSHFMTVLCSHSAVWQVPVWLSSCPILPSWQSLYDCPIVLSCSELPDFLFLQD